jgi:pyruvate dehydrogenase E2 component (dihydrolipoamide acetyltransferase)
MATEVVMPKLGLTMEKGTVGAWLVAEGETVQKGQALLEVITDKVTMEVEAQANGVLKKILVGEGIEVDVSTPIGMIADAGEDIEGLVSTVPAPKTTATSASIKTALETKTPPEVPIQKATQSRPPHRASPKARKIAAERGIELQSISGTGPGGRILSADLLAQAQPDTHQAQPDVQVTTATSRPDETGTDDFVALTRPQQITAQRLTESYQQRPHIHLSMEVSAVWLEQFRHGYKLEGHKVSYNDLIVKATAKALKEQPRINSMLEGQGLRLHKEVNIGIAVDTPKGLMVPVLHQADSKEVVEIAAVTAALVDRARQGQLAPDDMMGGTFTISNLGMFGVSQFTAIINPPQVAILAVGGVEKRVVALENDAMAVRPMLTLNLAADHRAIDGAVAARFLQRLRQIIETPGLLG